MIFVWIISGLIFLLVLFMFMRIDIRIEYTRTDNDDSFRVSIFKKFINIEIPFVDIDSKKGFLGAKLTKKVKTKKGKAVDKKNKSFISFEQMKDTIEKAHYYFKTYSTVLKSGRQYIKQKITCEHIVFHLNLGLEDAAVTGISMGVIWGTTYNILSILNQYIRFKETDIKINPYFNVLKLDIKLSGIFTFRIVHIINMFLIMLFSFVKVILLNIINHLGIKIGEKIHS